MPTPRTPPLYVSRNLSFWEICMSQQTVGGEWEVIELENWPDLSRDGIEPSIVDRASMPHHLLDERSSSMTTCVVMDTVGNRDPVLKLFTLVDDTITSPVAGMKVHFKPTRPTTTAAFATATPRYPHNELRSAQTSVCMWELKEKNTASAAIKLVATQQP